MNRISPYHVPRPAAIWMALVTVAAAVAAYTGGSGLAWAIWTAMSCVVLLGLLAVFVNALIQERWDRTRRRDDLALARAARQTLLVMDERPTLYPAQWRFTLAELVGSSRIVYPNIGSVALYGPGEWTEPEDTEPEDTKP